MEEAGRFVAGFSEHNGRTTLHPIGVTLLLCFGFAMLIVPRRYAMITMIACASFVAVGQRVVVATLDLYSCFCHRASVDLHGHSWAVRFHLEVGDRVRSDWYLLFDTHACQRFERCPSIDFRIGGHQHSSCVHFSG